MWSYLDNAVILKTKQTHTLEILTLSMQRQVKIDVYKNYLKLNHII